jgi:hypothetical protein
MMTSRRVISPKQVFGLLAARSRRQAWSRSALLTTLALLALGTSLALGAAPAVAAPPVPNVGFVQTTATTAMLRGSPDNGAENGPVEPGAYQYLYKATKIVSTAECESAGAAKAPVPPGMYLGLEREVFIQEVTGLTPNTEYIDCLAAEDEKGEKATSEAVAFVTFPEAPETREATEITGKSAKLEGALRPSGAKLKYYFEYNQGTSCTGGLVTPTAEGEGAVEAVVEGLTPHATYTACLVALGAGGETAGQAKSFETLTSPPIITEEFTTNVSAAAATLNAVVNPGALATSYRFDYEGGGTHASVPVEHEGFAGSGNVGVPVGVLVEGLTPGTTYHYRLVATNALGKEVSGKDRTFTTQSTASGTGLVDGRGWELVSPPNTHGTALLAFHGSEGGLIQAAERGGAFTYIALGPVGPEAAGNRGSKSVQQLLAARGVNGWSTQDIATPHEAVAGPHGGYASEYQFFSADLSAALVEPEGATPLSPQTSERTPYLRNDGACEPTPTEALPATCYTPLVTAANVLEGTKFGGVTQEGLSHEGLVFLDATPDLSHVVLHSPVQLTAAGSPGEGVYEWSGGKLQDVGSGQLGYNDQNTRHAVSNDGSRVVWEGRRSSPNGGEPAYYLRDMAREENVQIDAAQGVPEPGGTNGSPESVYRTANDEDSRVFFTTAQALTAGSPANHINNLYVFEVTSGGGEPLAGKLTDLTAGLPGVNGVIGASEDGSYVYFAAGESLYVERYDEVTKAWAPPRFIAALSQADKNSWGTENNQEGIQRLTARVSPDGRYLAFMSSASLTGYDNHDANSGEPDEEVYEYDAGSGGAGSLTCASCDPTGARPTGIFDHAQNEENSPPLVDQPQVWSQHWLAGSIPGFTDLGKGLLLGQPRYLDDNGRLFFDSPVGLVAQDSNGVEDAYEYEPEGAGPQGARCGPGSNSGIEVFKPAHGFEVGGVPGEEPAGCVGLISSGSSSEESAFLDASGTGPGGEEGEDVFFMTAARLAPADVDNALHVYDAHECSAASPCPPGAGSVPPACTTAESCRVASPAAPAIFGAPASATFDGQGNLTPPPPAVVKKAAKKTVRCKKGFVKKRGKCVKNVKQKSKKAKKAKKARKARKASNDRRTR